MKFVTNLFRGKPASLEEGPVKHRSTNEYYVLHRDESRTNCGRLVQIVKVILCIELIILIGWLGCVSFPYFITDQNIDCGGSAIGCKTSQIDYADIEVKSSRGSRSVGDTEDGREKCERNANATRRSLDSLAVQYVIGESSDSTVVQLRRNFIELTISESLQVIIAHSLVEGFFKGFVDDIAETNTSLFSLIPNDRWHGFMNELSEEFLNSTDSQNRERLEARGPPTEEMTSEFRRIAESLYIDLRDCNRLLLDSLLSVRKLNKSDEDAPRLKRESKPVSQLTIDCRDAETQLMEERRERLEVLAADVANDRPIGFGIRNLLTSIEAALNTRNPSEVTVEDDWLQDNSGLIPWKRFVSDASLQLKREFYELVRDEFLELRNANNQSFAWEGYDLEKTYKNWTDGLGILQESESPEAVLNITIKLGKAFNLHYVEAEEVDRSVESEAPTFGTLTYLDAEPEKPSLRRLSNILNGFVRLYFRVINRLGPCQPTAGATPTRNRRFVKKRFVTSKPIPKLTATCWNEEEEDRVLLEERRARQEIFAKRRGLGYEYEQRTQQMFLDGIGKALNATSTSEIRFADELMDHSMVLPSIKYLVTNASLKLQKEGYELARDLFMEMHGLNHRGSEWEGWEQDDIARNLTNAIFFSQLNMSSQSIFDNFVRFGEAFNLRYEKPANRASGNAPYGKFSNLGKEPEKLGVRHLRHTLDSFVRLYYKIQNPSTSGVCGSTVQARAKRSIEKRFVTADPVPEINVMCWSKEQDPVLLKDRGTRLERFLNKKVKVYEHNHFAESYLESLAAALNATSITEINFDEMLVHSTPILRFMNYLLRNSSLELHKEGYEIIRDMYLEMLELQAHSPEWDGYDEHSINENMTALGIPGNVKMNSESIFNGIVKFGIPFNLHYEELANSDSGDEPDKPVFGKLIYVGEAPEKLGVRRLRHILDGFVKLYFKIQDPSTLMVCNSTVQPSVEGGEGETPTREQRSVEKRSATTDPVPESITTKCWSEEQDKILEEERLERLAAFAFRTNKKVIESSYTKAYLEGIEAALNATSISEIHFEDNMRKSPLLTYMESLCENSTLNICKEGYEINRDLYLELYELRNHNPEWDGYNMERIEENITASHIFSNMTKEAMFNDIVTFSNAFNLRYEELGNKESGDKSNKPVFGKFTYVGEEPETLGIRHLRHILDAFVKFYFKTQDPSSICKDDTSTTTPAVQPTNAKCWNTEQDPVLLEERRERLEAYANWNKKNEAKILLTKNYLDTLGEALNASSVSEIHFAEPFLRWVPILSFIQNITMNNSLELCKEGLEIARDMWLEIDELEDHTSEWEGYDLETVLKNLTDISKSDGFVPTLASILNDLRKSGRAFNLHYEEIKNGDNGDKTDKPVLGKFTYLGEEPEKLGVRHMRHILDGFMRFLFKVQNPSTWGMCDATVQTRSKPSVKKRAVTADPVPESITTKCWSEEQDKILEEERLERLAAFAFRTNKKVMESSYTKAYLEGIEAALNATSISEIHFEDNMRKFPLLTYMESLCENSTLDICKEGYKINRDLYLELYELKNHNPEWDGYNMERIEENITASHIFSNMTKEAVFNDIFTFSNAFNLRYEELGNRESGDEPNKPVFGKFTYLGEEPEKLGIRHLRHILDAFAKFYFKTQDPSSICKGDTSITTPAPEPTNAKCWNTAQDPALLEERRERLEAYANWNKKNEANMLFAKNYLDILGEALNASSTSEIHFDEHVSRSLPLLSFIQDLAKNSSLELCKEGLEIARDMWLEINELEDHTSEWEGYDLETIQKNVTDISRSDGSIPTLEMMFNDLRKFGRALNLRYEEIEKGDSGDKTDKPVLGKFTYLGEEPEKLGVRHMRHILDGFVRFFFKVQNPSAWGICDSTAQTRAEPSVKKRAVTADPVPESITTKCWSEEQDKILEDERLERLAAFAFRTDKKVLESLYTNGYLEGIETALNATSISEIQVENNFPKSPMLTYMESLCENSSLDIRKEGYEICRDLHLEMCELANHSPEWDGYNMERINKNISTSHIFFVNMTKEAMFNNIVSFSNVFNLRYEELGNRESGADPKKPVFGKFTYLGEEPEKMGIRHLRHILDAFVKFYFKTQDPSSICKDDTPTTTAAAQPTNAKCWNTEQDPVLLEERRERLEAYANWNKKNEAKMLFTKNYLDALGEALNASSTSEIHFNETLSRLAPELSFIQNLAQNSSLELCKEGLEIARDMWLEIDELADHTPEWEGYDLETIQKNLTDISRSDGSIPTLEIMLDTLRKFGRAFNLRYEEIENGDSGDKTDKPVLGKFTYLGEEPEKLGVRHMRHILDGFERFYFKVRYPSIAPVCNSNAEGGEKINTGQAVVPRIG